MTDEEPSGLHKKRRRMSQQEKERIISETFLPGSTVTSVAQKHGLSISLLFRWRRASLGGTDARDNVAAPPSLLQLRKKVANLESMLGRKILEIEELEEELAALRARAGDATE
jgi:transposase